MALFSPRDSWPITVWSECERLKVGFIHLQKWLDTGSPNLTPVNFTGRGFLKLHWQLYNLIVGLRSDLLLNHSPLTAHTTGLALWIIVTKKANLPLLEYYSFLLQLTGTLTQSLYWYKCKPANTQIKMLELKQTLEWMFHCWSIHH